MLALMYHRIGDGKFSNTLEMMERHLEWLSTRFETILPGDDSKRGICLTFDDASFDFYHYVFPLLKKFKMRALVGVATRYIIESTELDPEERLAIPYTMAMQDGFFDQKAPFCSWVELEEMVQSGLVEVASHSHMHCNLTFDFVDLNREVIQSREILEARLPQAVTSFIYPFGRVNSHVHTFVSTHYPYAFRIGNGAIGSWHSSKPLMRVCGDNMKSPSALFSARNRLQYRLKSFC
ncbi:MAG: hypothetical protein S4CHLAM81_14540 [Chlamydiales bacterium]|nr:hypothetical protein [Chlamydiales bacterium]MCH9636226.1 hypothetical protein [Chlamydiales bacterium]